MLYHDQHLIVYCTVSVNYWATLVEGYYLETFWWKQIPELRSGLQSWMKHGLGSATRILTLSLKTAASKSPRLYLKKTFLVRPKTVSTFFGSLAGEASFSWIMSSREMTEMATWFVGCFVKVFLFKLFSCKLSVK